MICFEQNKPSHECHSFSNQKSLHFKIEFTSNWKHINQIGEGWADVTNDLPNLTLTQWAPFLPSLDLWLDVNEEDIHHVIHLIPTLDWNHNESLGIRLVFAPKNIETLYKEFITVYQSARKIEPATSSEEQPKLRLWPESMRDFLDRKIRPYFEVKAFILDPQKCEEPDNGKAKPQSIPSDSEALGRDPFDGLFKIDVISAQRGFSDPKTENESHGGFASLSTQLRQYYTKHIDPSETPDESDLDALQTIEDARTNFDKKLKSSFAPAIGELEMVNYPGFSNPQIYLTSKIDVTDSLDHKTAVQFNLSAEQDGINILSLPEQYNGLGYQNLISMVFKLIRFRDEWMRVGKAAKRESNNESIIEPLHIVLIEEPEAHLHAQVQQVFIKKAYTILRNHANLKKNELSTQMIVSTHSSHIAHELEFTCLRYFRREPASQGEEVPFGTVVNLSTTFGDSTDTTKFVTRYIKSTHCDLFFADAVILVEGSAERMLVPHFIRHKFPNLDKSYISILEIGGSHAHRLKPLLEILGILSLVITDLDSIEKDTPGKVLPKRNQEYRTGNSTLKKWIPKKESLDEILTCSDDGKQTENKQIRVAYQCPIQLTYNHDSGEKEAIPYTFEDSLALTNLKLFRNYQDPNGLLKKLTDALDNDSLDEASKEMFESLGSGSKAEMALELFYLTEPRDLEPPSYISEGLQWLENKLAEKQQDFLTTETTEVKND